MTATEVLGAGQRIGFDLQDNIGRTTALARMDAKTDISVGRYYVDIKSLDTFIDPLFTFGADQLLYIDEIGRMQLYSQKFQSLVREYLNAPNDYLGTISSIYEHSFIAEARNRNDILLCTITPANRNEMSIALQAAVKNRLIFNALSAEVQAMVLVMARGYLANGVYISLKKLFNNTIVYVAQERLAQESPVDFTVHGNHGDHHVKLGEANYCDCDFFNGRGRYVGMTGECSHIQVAKILKK